MKLVLDTSTYCDYAEGFPEVVDVLAEFGDEIYLPVVVLSELTFGFLRGSRQEENEKKLQNIIESLKIGIININRDVGRKYALIYDQLVRKGRKIPINDVWIAACCMDIGGTLLTRDSYFDVIDALDRFPLHT
ncbi:type II toxin-antitoxin system VapC family toxin [Marispirochaeta sp.]|uniref:type II toxin-antitoxin system VapC family toxin n=1 Tax=Marispirochaeta sp. TaxID=2038653 RepID=UPI0029C633CF|nr:type II toxin-antitoxin system VapC family toxin [Marispirochaeta sp.]